MRLRLRLPSPYSNTRVIILENASLTVNHLKEKVAEELCAVNEQLSLSQFSLSLNGKEPLQVEDDSCSLSSIGIVPGDLVRLIAASTHEPDSQRVCMHGNVGGTGVAIARVDTQRDDSKRSPAPDSDATVLLRKLVEMGFEEHRSAVALATSGNDLQLALDVLSEDQIQVADQPSAGSAVGMGAAASHSSQTTALERLTSLYESAGVKTCRHAVMVLLHWIILETTSERGCGYELEEGENGVGWRQQGSVANTEFRLKKAREYGRICCCVRYVGMPRTPRGLILFSNGVRSRYTHLFEFNFVDYTVPLSAGASLVYRNPTDAKELLGRLLHSCLMDFDGCSTSASIYIPYSNTGSPGPCDRRVLGLPDLACSQATQEQNATSIAALSALHSSAGVETCQQAMIVLVQWILNEMEACLGLCPSDEQMEEDMPRLKACVDRELQCGRDGSETGRFRITYMHMPRSPSGVLRVSVRYDNEERFYFAALDETKYINLDCSSAGGVSETYLQPLCARDHIGRSFIGRGCQFIENAQCQYNRHHLLFLPPFVAEMIFSNLDTRSLARLYATCSHLQRLVSASAYFQYRGRRSDRKEVQYLLPVSVQ